MTAPLVTIGIPAFDAADSVARAVRSALAQTWRPIEVVVVDDASTDGTREVLEALSAQHPELRVFRNPVNSGVAATRNRILAEAQGAFVAFFDDDDESVPERVATQLRRILAYERDPAADRLIVCHTARRQIYPDGSRRLSRTMGESEGQIAPHGPAVAERILLGNPLADGYGACPTCTQMARLDTYRSLGGFDPQFRRSEDTDFNVRLARAGGHFVGIAEPLVIQTMTRTSEKSLADELRYMLMLLDKHRDMLDAAGQYAFCRSWIEGKYAFLSGHRGAFVLGLVRMLLRYPVTTVRRLCMALPNVGLNRAFGQFHRRAGG